MAIFRRFSYRPRSSTYHDVQNDAHGPDVVERDVVWNALQDLRGRVGSTAAERLADGGLLEEPREAEVGNLEIVLVVKEDVLTL